MSSGEALLLAAVRDGDVALVAAAERVRPCVRLTAAYRAAGQAERVAAMREIGTDQIFGELVQAL
jgi:hypothetical protein